MLDIIKAHAVNNLCYIAAQKMIPKGIVVHSTGANNQYLRRYVDAPVEVGINQYGNHWNTARPGGTKVCVHAFVGYDKDRQIRVAEILPLNICCWGVGSGKNGSYNYNPAYIQFEICEDALEDKTYYNRVFGVAAEYCAELCEKYKIDVSQIVGHCEAYRQGYGSNHADPEHWMGKFGETMEDFRKRVSGMLQRRTEGVKNRDLSAPETTSIEKGDLVSIADNATYYNGTKIPAWVKAHIWYVHSTPVGDRVVIDRNEKGTNSICSPVHKKFLTVVKKANASAPTHKTIPAQTACPYLVKITADYLNVRKGAGTDTAKVGSITDRGVYTIVEERNGPGATKWGKLKSGAGWISLDFVKKL
ncbi:MAG: N-acetylmuramoyl-L-alanine amidase [Oscillospiraceae bacterium]|nr:N-acetylmuramoyl-L-alanine amidase [Oscillospiraceae bacterium]